MTTWTKRNLAEILAATAAKHAQDEALVIAGQRLTWAELRDNVREVAHGLRAAGIGHGDHLAVCMGNSLEWVIFFYAAASIGAVTVPVNTRFKADEMLYCLKQADVKLLFVADRFLNIDFIAMLRSICPALDRTLPDPGLPLL
ncbi:MAG: AMP-binding protein, partial [Betaproteobacteria bacterium]|nr:AMP-binding protein [Betaproteobacteria bacterium]